MATNIAETRPPRPSRHSFEVAVICALTLEADAVDALFDFSWDNEGLLLDKAPGDPNAYSAGVIGQHNVVLARMPGMGKVNAAIVASNCRTSFPNIKLALVVGVCGVVPFDPSGGEIVLGDIIISNGVVQYDFGRRRPGHFMRKDTLLDNLGRPNVEIRAILAKLNSLRGREQLCSEIADYLGTLQRKPLLAAKYPGKEYDRLFESTYVHDGDKETCEQLGCSGNLIPRQRLQTDQGDPQPAVHFGLVASGDSVIKSGEDRDAVAANESVIAFEMEGAGIWDSFPCVVVKGACDYADSHKSKAWQRYAAATAAACMKAFLNHWVPAQNTVLDPTSRPAGPWFLVPYSKNAAFVGRQSILEHLRSKLLPSASRPRVALTGLGGVGKTQIASAHAYWLNETYPKLSVFWVHASSVERFRESYLSIAQECHVPGFDDPKADILTLVKTWLERTHTGPWLMIIDNADDQDIFFLTQNGEAPAQCPCLSQFIPDCPHGSILITTRNKQVGFMLTQGQNVVEVERMDPAEAGRLVRSALGGVEAADVDISTLTCRLDYLPLALAQAAAYIQMNSMAVGRYLQILERGDDYMVELLSKEFLTIGRDSETPQAVAATWMISFKQIETQNPVAAELLALISFFDRHAIPIELLADYCKRQRSMGGDKQEDDLQEELQLEEALGLLKAFSFLAADSTGNLSVHRLVQLISRKWLANKGTIDRFAEHALMTVSGLYPYGKFENRDICTIYLPHVFAILGSEGSAPRLDKAGKTQLIAKATLLHNTAGLFFHQGQWKDAEKLQLRAVETFQTVLGKEHPNTLRSMNDLALTYRNQGRWKEAESLLEQMLFLRKYKFSNEHPDVLTNMANLASTYTSQGRWKEAESLEVRVLKVCREVLGEKHPETLRSMANLSLTYRNQGRWKEAEGLQVQVMETRRQLRGEEDPSTLTSMANLALIYKGQGRWEEAESLEVKAVETFQQLLGQEHPETLSSKTNLATTYRNRGRWKEAELLDMQVMEKRQQMLGGEHPDMLISMSNLAETFWYQGRLEEAGSLELQVMETRLRVLGQEHPDTLSTMSNLAFTWKSQGRNTEAIALMERCIELRTRVLGPSHHRTVSACLALNRWHKTEGIPLLGKIKGGLSRLLDRRSSASAAEKST